MTGRTRDAAGCVIRDAQGRLLLVHQAYGPKKWTLPGGVVEDGESAWAAVVREVREELGIEVRPTLRGLYHLAHRDAYVFIFTGELVAGAPHPDGSEIAECGYFPPDGLPVPLSTFTRERIADAVSTATGVIMKTQHIRDYRV